MTTSRGTQRVRYGPPPEVDSSTRAAFDADLAKMNAHLLKLGAVHCARDDIYGDYAWFDADKVTPQFVSTYSALLSFGYANRLIPLDDEATS